MSTPEKLVPAPIPEVQHIAETVEIPEHIEKGGVASVPTQVTAQVTDDAGNQVLTTPTTQAVTITLPATQDQLIGQSKGKITEALTWLATYWLRMVKKALHFGWRIRQ